ncbi:hypothetical protein WICMUC_004389 [Wickerhamomyces mucosus]|uniref:CCAAT-binding factor domain-containing protein n=2 Tax=Saccharomycotina TaxID=147537 RepID=A0A9P8PJ23_9ASCO|nr:hypothetical protein WICMUC_004389 [Wickerhamomyces mucosus]
MDGIKLDLSSLREKVSNKLKADSIPKNGKDHKQNNKKNSKDRNNASNKINKLDDQKTSKSDDSQQKTSSVDDVLRREALELGATEDDLKLLDGIDEGDQSEQEFDFKDDDTKDGAFGNELESFMKNLGFTGQVDVVDDDIVAKEEPIPEEDLEDSEEVKEGQEEPQSEEEEEEEEEEEKEEEEVEEEQDLEVENIYQAAPVEEKELPTHQRVETTTILDTSKLLIEPRNDWYNVPLGNVSEADAKLTKEQIDRLYQRGKEYLEAENKGYYDEFSRNSSQRKFLSQMLSDGTLSDKISALTLLIQEAPLHNTKSFETLLGFTNKKSRNSALQSLNALKDLLINGLLPDRKLRYFKNQPLSLLTTKKQLAIFFFEDFLKTFYFKIIQILERLSHDPIIHVRMNIVSHIFDLLKSKPEQEVNLLRLGVNKIGDIDNKVSSKTSYQILQLEQAHPNMKKIIIDSVIDTTFKKNNDYHSKYYSILTLNQTILTRREEDVANELVKTYFSLFEKLLIESDPDNVETKKPEDISKPNNYKNKKKNFKKGKKGGKSVKNDKTEQEVVEEKNSKLFSALLTGLNRSFPFSNLPSEVFSKHLDTLFKITHSSNFNTSVQALVLIFQITTSQQLNNDRFYRTLYESLFDTRLVNSSKQGIYLNLLFKALKQDSDISRVLAFVKRIVQICYNWLNIGSVAGLFYLLAELEKAIPQLRNLVLNTPTDHKFAEEEDIEYEEADDKKSLPVYDGRKRDPRFANASTSSLWEINEFLNHYHPTVQLYAESFLNQEKQTKPDLGLFTLSHFLDRFVYRNAKQKPTTKGSSIMQPLGGAHTGSLLVKASNKVMNELPANTENWIDKKAQEIRPDEKFFYQYFSSKETTNKFSEPKAEDFENDSELDDDEVWDALVKSQPDIDGGDIDSDIDDFSDLDADDFSDVDDDEVQEDQESLDDKDQGSVSGDEEGESDFELQTVGLSDDDQGEEIFDEEIENRAEPEFNGFSESEDEEAELFKGDSDDEYGSDEDAETDEEDEEEEQAEISKKSKKRSMQDSNEKSNKKSKKSKIKDLPVFASADDYAKYLDSDEN